MMNPSQSSAGGQDNSPQVLDGTQVHTHPQIETYLERVSGQRRRYERQERPPPQRGRHVQHQQRPLRLHERAQPHDEAVDVARLPQEGRVRDQLPLVELDKRPREHQSEQGAPPELHEQVWSLEIEVGCRPLELQPGPAELRAQVDERREDEDGVGHLDHVLAGAEVPLRNKSICRDRGRRRGGGPKTSKTKNGRTDDVRG